MSKIFGVSPYFVRNVYLYAEMNVNTTEKVSSNECNAEPEVFSLEKYLSTFELKYILEGKER